MSSNMKKKSNSKSIKTCSDNEKFGCPGECFTFEVTETTHNSAVAIKKYGPSVTIEQIEDVITCFLNHAIKCFMLTVANCNIDIKKMVENVEVNGDCMWKATK